MKTEIVEDLISNLVIVSVKHVYAKTRFDKLRTLTREIPQASKHQRSNYGECWFRGRLALVEHSRSSQHYRIHLIVS